MSIDEEILTDGGDANPGGAPRETEVSNQGPRFQIPAWLKAKTGEGSVESYVEHPLNINGNLDFARVLRGLTGMFNNLNYAIIDVVLGGLKFLKKDKLPHE